MQNQQPSTLKEIRVHGTQDFPCAFYQTGTRIKGNMVKHHWHEEVELLYFSGGEFCLEVNMERFNISEECFYFINPGELHSIYVEKNGGCVENAVVFHMDMLSAAYALDQIQTNLIQPVQNGSIQFPRCLRKNEPAFEPVENLMKKSVMYLAEILFGRIIMTARRLRMISPDSCLSNQRCFGFWQFCLRIICLR